MRKLLAIAAAGALCPVAARADTASWTTEADVLAGALDDLQVDGSGVLSLAPSSWWDPLWAWRSEVTITEGSGRALADYSVRLVVDTGALVAAGSLESDGADLRFVDDASAAVLGHWVESGLNGPSTVIWVKVPTIPASGTTTLWMYHGNPAATDVSDKASAMLWWDAFSSGGTGAYQSQGLNGDPNENWAAGGGWAHNLNNVYTHASLLVAGLTLDDDFLVETSAYTNDDDGIGIVSHVNGDGSNYYTTQSWGNQPARSGICKNVSEGNAVASAGLSVCCGGTHLYGMIQTAGQTRMLFDGSTVATWTDPNRLPAGRVGLLATQLDPAGWFDFLLIRAYVEPEPTGALGAPTQDPGDLGTWESDVVDAGCAASWTSLSWSETLPPGTDVEAEVRSGPTPSPDSGWSAWWGPVSTPGGSALAVADGAFAQVRLTLTGTSTATPTASAVTLEYWPQDDLDGDGAIAAECGGDDCDDGEAGVFPGAVELCDAVDQDCDGDLVEGFADTDGDLEPDCIDEDDDDDGSLDGDDCAPLDAAIHPGADELCDGLDQDCDGAIDEGFDGDGDGVSPCAGDCDDGDASVFPGAPEQCEDGVDQDCDGQDLVGGDADGDGVGACEGDCDDGDAAVFPGAAEQCDGRDGDCDGVVPADELDGDGDGVSPCAGDCDDADANVHPDAAEVCDDGVDQDCDGSDDGDEDADGDGWPGCDGDCDDGDANVHPDADEVCDDGLDNDCDGVTDENEDADGDGWGICDGDCEDEDAEVRPGAPEVCEDGVDQDCDGEDISCITLQEPAAMGGCSGCAAAVSAEPGASALAAGVLLLGLGIRRRRTAAPRLPYSGPRRQGANQRRVNSSV